MKSFAPTALLLPLLAFASSTIALTVGQVVININAVATVSGNLNGVLAPLSIYSDPAAVATAGETAVNEFTTIISMLAADVDGMDGTVFGDADAKTIVAALNGFVEIHQQLLATVIGKQGILAQFGVTAPVAAVLRSLEAGIDSFTFALIAMIPTQTSSVQNSQSSLDVSVQNDINAYEQICIPSPLYPTLMPICASL